jgi:hypothetical protein
MVEDGIDYRADAGKDKVAGGVSIARQRHRHIGGGAKSQVDRVESAPVIRAIERVLDGTLNGRTEGAPPLIIKSNMLLIRH